MVAKGKGEVARDKGIGGPGRWIAIQGRGTNGEDLTAARDFDKRGGGHGL